MHTVDGNPVLWKSRRQDRTAQSSCEAEFYSAASASKDAIFLDRLVKSLRPHHDRTIPVLHMDNKSAIQSAINAQDNERQRHIDLRAHRQPREQTASGKPQNGHAPLCTP